MPRFRANSAAVMDITLIFPSQLAKVKCDSFPGRSPLTGWFHALEPKEVILGASEKMEAGMDQAKGDMKSAAKKAKDSMNDVFDK